MTREANFAEEVQIENRSRDRVWLKINGEYFPYCTAGISVETDTMGQKHLNVRIPCDKVIHTFDHADDED